MISKEQKEFVKHHVDPAIAKMVLEEAEGWEWAFFKYLQNQFFSEEAFWELWLPTIISMGTQTALVGAVRGVSAALKTIKGIKALKRMGTTLSGLSLVKAGRKAASQGHSYLDVHMRERDRKTLIIRGDGKLQSPPTKRDVKWVKEKLGEGTFGQRFKTNQALEGLSPGFQENMINAWLEGPQRAQDTLQSYFANPALKDF